jgi:hypothetical protein
MITIFGDFGQFSAKKLAFFSKTNVMIKNLHNLALFWVKNANFFCENIFKIITSVPGWKILVPHDRRIGFWIFNVDYALGMLFQLLQDAWLVLHDQQLHGPRLRPALLRALQVEVQRRITLLQWVGHVIFFIVMSKLKLGLVRARILAWVGLGIFSALLSKNVLKLLLQTTKGRARAGLGFGNCPLAWPFVLFRKSPSPILINK